jgi:hypothetical protein
VIFNIRQTMGYAEIQKVHYSKQLPSGSSSEGRAEVLRIVLAIALDAEMAAWCLGCQRNAQVLRWPSTLYRVLAQAAMQSAPVWRRCALLLDRSLHEALAAYDGCAPAELAELFIDGRESLAGDELAALLWCLVRQRSASHDLIAERLGRELEVVAAQRLSGAANS